MTKSIYAKYIEKLKVCDYNTEQLYENMVKQDIDGLKFVSEPPCKGVNCFVIEKNNTKYCIGSIKDYPEVYQIVTIIEDGEIDDESSKDFESIAEIINYVVEKI
jgi:hypothetical protein